MIPTEYNGQDVFLLLAEPDWTAPVRVGLEVVQRTDTGLTGRESRRPFALAPRIVMEFTATSAGRAATELIAGLRAWTNEPVLVPFWPGAARWADRDAAPFRSKVRLAYRADFSQVALFEEGDEPGWVTAGDLVAPVLWGRIEQNPPRWLNPTTAQLDVSFVEQGDADSGLEVAAVEWTAGPTPSEAWTEAPAILPYRIHWAAPTYGATVEVLRDRIGFGKTPAETVYPQAPTRAGEAAMVESGAAVAGLVRFFIDHAPGQPFWAPGYAAAAILTGNVADGETAVPVVSGHDVQAGDWVAFDTADGSPLTVARVSAVAAESITLESTAGDIPGSALMTHLLLCRFERPRITVDWISPTAIRVRMAIREVPAEYTPATGETLGETLGALPVRAWLYEIEEPGQTAPTVRRYTSFERDLVIDGNTYTAAQIDHGAIRQGIALDRDEVEIRFALSAGDSNHPFARLATMRAEGPITVRIHRAELTYTA